MDKKNFLNMFFTEDKNLLSNLYDKIILANKTGKTIYCSEFYTPNVWSKLLELQGELGVNLLSCGVFEEADRRMIAFSQEEELQFPVKFLCIKIQSKFGSPKHKDYLGALMALGIKREKFGDVVLDKDKCYLPLCEEVSDYVISNLSSVGNSPCKVEVVDSSGASLLKPSYEENIIIVSSLRIDCVVGSVCKISRTEAEELLHGGKVLVNYAIAQAKEKKVDPGSLLVIRGYGKYKIVEKIGTTQKDRIKILVKKYI